MRKRSFCRFGGTISVCEVDSLRKIYSLGAICDAQKDGFKASSVKQLLVSRRNALEALFVGMRKPSNNDYALTITELLSVIRNNNPNLRKFGLRMGWEDPELKELNEQLREVINDTEREIEGLEVVIVQ